MISLSSNAEEECKSDGVLLATAAGKLVSSCDSSRYLQFAQIDVLVLDLLLLAPRNMISKSSNAEAACSGTSGSIVDGS